MGWPASSHAPFMDYILADRVVAPPHLLEQGFSEKLIVMPHSYYVTDYAQSAPRLLEEPAECSPEDAERGEATPPGVTLARRELRREEGLPTQDDAMVVFCSYNQHYKLDAAMAAVWANILRRVPHSVLFLLDWGGYAVPQVCITARGEVEGWG
jgi:protein O-GlcNAc transferase